MPIIVNTLPNASNNLNGIKFERGDDGHMHSIDSVEGSMLELFLSIPGFRLLTQAEPVDSLKGETDPNTDDEYAWHTIPQKITGSVVGGGAMNLNIPQPDGSVIQLQAAGPTDQNPVLRGDFGMAAAAAASWAARATANGDQVEQATQNVATGQPAGEGSGEGSAPPNESSQEGAHVVDSAEPSADAGAKPAAGRAKPAAKK